MPTTPPDNREDFAIKGAQLLSAMANAKRVAILTILQSGEQSVGSLSEMVDLSHSALSQHLAKLRHARLVTTRRDAQTVYYSSTSGAVARILATLEEIAGVPLTQSRVA